MSDDNQPPEFLECHDTGSCTELTTDFIFFLEIFVSINTSIINPEDNKYELRRLVIFKNYLFSWLPVDVLAILPRFLRLITSEDYEFVSILKFARVSRIFKLVRLVKLFKAASSSISLAEYSCSVWFKYRKRECSWIQIIPV